MKQGNEPMFTLEQLENGTAKNQIIVLRGVYKTKHTVMPAKNTQTNWFEGVPRLSDEEKKGLNYFTTPESRLELYDGREFDLTKEVDRKNWEWVKHTKEVVESFEAAQMSKVAMFYVHIEGREAAKENKAITLKFEAMQFVFNDSPTNYENRALILGTDMKGEEPGVIKRFLLDIAENEPQRLLLAYKSKSLAIQLLYLKAKNKNKIIEDNGVIKYGIQILGMSDESSIAFLQNPENKDLIEMLERDVNPDYFINEKVDIKKSFKNEKVLGEE